jgi:drug/metabolite transporter (DMT)-like permease
MATRPGTETVTPTRPLHKVGVFCGLAAGAWLGAAEAPTKFVALGFSPFLISLGMVAGVFVARWTFPTMLKGTGSIVRDFREKPHLAVWAVLAGVLWAVANTLTVFAIRNIGLAVAFPLWNTNSIVGLFWGWLLFNELRGSDARQWSKVLGGALAILLGACLLAYATASQPAGGPHRTAAMGILAALGAGLLWGTMYIPYRKAYISGMNPLSFVTVFTFGELATTLGMALIFTGGFGAVLEELRKMQPALFWLFLGGFCWVIGDLFQQYAAKYIGIGRGIPLSNTNQVWGLAWGVLVFGELAGTGAAVRLVAAGSLIMIAGAAAISLAEASDAERAAWKTAVNRECSRYGMDPGRITAAIEGVDVSSRERTPLRWWDLLIMLAAVGIFCWLGSGITKQSLSVNLPWMMVLTGATLVSLALGVAILWKHTRFS